MGYDVVTGGGGFIGSHLVDRLIASKRARSRALIGTEPLGKGARNHGS